MSSLISCVIPVYNGERFVTEAIESALQQSYRPLQVVVVDDGSTDDTPERLRSFENRIDVVTQKNAGAGAARNRGVEAARGQWIAFLDSDDLWLPDKLALQMACLTEQPGAQACGCLVENFWEAELAEEAARLRDSEFTRPTEGFWQGMLIHRDVFERIGGPDPEFRHFDGAEWLHRARSCGVVMADIDRVLVRRRIHRGNQSRRRGKRTPEEMLLIAEKLLARRRAADPER